MMKKNLNESFSKSLLEVGLIHLFVGKKEDAIKYLELVLKKDKKNIPANLYLGLLKEDQQCRTIAIKSLRKRMQFYEVIQHINTFLEVTGDSEMQLESIPLLTNMVKNEKQLDNNSYYQFSNAINLRPRIGNSYVPDLFNPSQTVDKNKEEVKKFTDLREKYALDFFKVAIQKSELAYQSFESFYVLLKRNKVSDKEIFTYAKEALNASLKAQYLHHSFSSSRHSSYNNQVVEYKTAPEFMLEYALENNKAVLDYAKSLKNDHFELVKKVSQINLLLELPEAEFITKCNSFIESLPKHSQFHGTYLTLVMKVHQHRQLKCDLTPMITKSILSCLNNSHSSNRNFSFVGAWIKTLKEQKKDETVKAFYATILGEVSKVLVEWEKESSEINIVRNNHHSRWYKFENLFRTTFENKTDDLALEVVANALGENNSKLFSSFVFYSGNMEYKLRKYREKLVSDYKTLAKTKLVKSLGEFSPMPTWTRSGLDKSLLTTFVDQLKNSSKKKNIIDELTKVEKKTFGQELLLTLLSKNKETEVYKFLDQHHAAIKNLPAKNQEDLIDALQVILVDKNYYQKDAKCVSSVKSLISKPVVKTGAEEQLKNFMSQVIGHNEYNYRSTAKKLIKKWVVTKPDFAGRVLDGTVMKLFIYYAQNMSRYSSNSRDVIESFFNDLKYDMTKEGSAFLFSKIEKMRLSSTWRKNMFATELCQRMISYANSKDRYNKSFELINMVAENKNPDLSVLGCVKEISRLQKEDFEKLLALPELQDSKFIKYHEIQLCVKNLYQYRYGKNSLSDEFCRYYTHYLRNPNIRGDKKVYTAKLIVDKFGIKKSEGERLKLLYAMVDVLGIDCNARPNDLSSLKQRVASALVMSFCETAEWDSATDKIMKELAKGGIKNSGSQNEQVMMLQLYLIKGKIEQAKALVNSQNKALQRYIETYLFFKFYGFEEEGVALYKKHLNQIDPTTNCSSCFHQHKHSSKDISDFQSGLQLSGKEKFMTDVSFTKLQRKGDDFKVLLNDLDQWIDKMGNNKDDYIMAFYNDDNTQEGALKFGKYIFKDFSPKRYLTANNDSIKRMYADYVLNSVSTLSDERLSEISSEIVKFYTKSNNTYQIRYFADKMSAASKRILEKDRTKFSDEKMVNFVGKFIQNSDYYYSTAELIGAITLSLQLENKEALLKTWLGFFNENNARNVADRAADKMRPYLENLYKTEENKVDQQLVKNSLAAVKSALKFKDSKKK